MKPTRDCCTIQHSDRIRCEHCHKTWVYGDYDGKCGLRPVKPSPEEEFWFNMAQASLTLAATCFIILVVWLMQPTFIAQLIVDILLWWSL